MMPRILIIASLTACLTGFAVAARVGPAGATGQEPTPAPKEEALESRVTAYWKLRQGKDLSGMYEFYSTEYRAKVPRAEFLKLTRLTRFDIIDFKVTGAETTGDRAEVKLTLQVIVPTLSGAKVDSPVTETWVREADKRWYKLDEPLVLPFPRDPSG